MRLTFLCWCLAACVIAASPVLALPLYDGNGELVNWDFGTGTLQGWQAGQDIEVSMDGPDHQWAATCKSEEGDLWLRQVADDLRGEWNPDYNMKLVDLTADIAWLGWDPQSTISFRLDWWAETYNGIDDPSVLPYGLGAPWPSGDPAAGYYVSDWVTYDFASIASGQWATVNPFNQILLPIQPRWVSVEVLYNQGVAETVWLDNVILTGRCVPEPSALVALLGGLGSLVGAGWRARRK